LQISLILSAASLEQAIEKVFLQYPFETDTFGLKSRQSIGDTAGNENVMNAGIAGDAPSMSSSSSLAIEALVLKIS